MSSRLQITERAVGDVVIFVLSGQLVYDEGTRLLRHVLTTAVVPGARKRLLDLEQVTYMDSGGRGSLVDMFRHVTRRGGPLHSLRARPPSRRGRRATHLIAA